MTAGTWSVLFSSRMMSPERFPDVLRRFQLQRAWRLLSRLFVPEAPAPATPSKRPGEAGGETGRPRNRITQLDGLRAVAILCVFLFHVLFVPFLWMGVDIFFVLSGFLITGVLLDRKAAGGSYFGNFYSRRARRVLAPCALLLLISSLLFGTGWVREWYWYAFFASNIPQIFH